MLRARHSAGKSHVSNTRAQNYQKTFTVLFTKLSAALMITSDGG